MTRAPWTAAQVAVLNRWQACTWLHPFTCRSGCRRVPLVATPEGWRCLDCDYRQDWAHRVMLSEPPPNPLARFTEKGGDA